MKIDSTKSFEERIEFLRNCSDLYESNGNSPVSDAEYDLEYHALQEINPDHPFFSEVGGRAENHIYGTSVKHDIVMGSLNKSPDITDFSKWLRSTFDHNETLTFIAEHKIDGLSLGCLYENGKLIRTLTRGDGISGIDVTEKAKYIEGIKTSIPYKGKIEVRGECYKDKYDFYERWAGEYANPRNFTAGAINHKDPLVTKERGLSFFAYETVMKDFDTEWEKLNFLVENGFKTFNMINPTAIFKASGKIDDIVEQIELYMNSIDRESLPYKIDGIVVKINDIPRGIAMGATGEGKYPRANRAIKFPCEQKETTIIDVEWNIGRTGSLSPVGILDPVELAETVVKRVTLHNPKFIDSMGLSIGCKIIIQKSGDIIPYVVRKTCDGTTKIKTPDNCPSCHNLMKWDETQTNKNCTNPECPAQINSQIEHWFKKIGVKGLGEGLISRITTIKVNGQNIVKSLVDMYDLDKFTDVLSKEFGDKAFSNILKNINSVRSVSLSRFVEALGIGKIGTMAKEIVKSAPTIKDIDALSINDLTVIPGFAETKARSFIEGWSERRVSLITPLLENCIRLEENVKKSEKLNGKSFCFTGSFTNPTRKQMEQMVVDNGGSLSSVSKNLTALIWDGEMTGSKYDKAKKNGIPIISQKDFLKYLE